MERYNGGSMEPLDFQFLKDRYDYELDRKDRISAAVNFPVTMLILVTGLLGAIYPKLQFTAPRVVIPVVLLFLAAGGWGTRSLYWFICAYRGSQYTYLPLLADLESAREEWRQFYDDAHADGAGRDFFTHEFRQRMIEAADSNTQTNDRRQAFLDRGNIALVWMFGLTAACAALSFLSVMFSS